MCIIVYKKKGLDFPSWKTLETCWDNNSDGAGIMYADGKNVFITKGLMSFDEFKTELKKIKRRLGNDYVNMPFVMHFRIQTQGGRRPDCTHPFVISENMDELRKLKTVCEWGVAHNGIISLTSDYSSYYSYSAKSYVSTKKTIDYSDTMEFITDYISLIIDGDKITDRQKILIERLADYNRFAFMNKSGYVKLLGKGWEKDKSGIWYSNGNYKPKVKVSNYTFGKKDKDTSYKSYGSGSTKVNSRWDDWYDDGWNSYDNYDYGYAYDDSYWEKRGYTWDNDSKTYKYNGNKNSADERKVLDNTATDSDYDKWDTYEACAECRDYMIECGENEGDYCGYCPYFDTCWGKTTEATVISKE